MNADAANRPARATFATVVALLLALLSASVSSRAHAIGLDLKLVNQSCVPLLAQSQDAIAALAVELAPEPFLIIEQTPDAGWPTIDPPFIVLRWCEPSRATVAIEHEGAPVQRQLVELGDADASARARTLAIAMAELERTGVAPPAPPPPPNPKPQPPKPAPPPSRPGTTPAQTAIGWQAGAAFRITLADPTWLIGPELGMHWGAASWGVLLLGYHANHTLGSADIGSAQVNFAYRLARFSSFVLRLGAELGVAHARGNPEPGVKRGQATVLQAAALLELAYTLAFDSTSGLELALHPGFARGAQLDLARNERITTHGAFLGARVSFVSGRRGATQ